MSVPHKIRVFEAFAGYGSQAMALKRLQQDFPESVEFEFVGISEIESNALKAYQAVHGDVVNYGDITKINWGGKYLILNYFATLSLVRTFPMPVSRLGLPKVAAHGHLFFGNARKQS